MAVVLASGGMDSTVLLAHLKASGEDPIPLFVDYGQNMACTEWKCLRAQCEAIGLRAPEQVSANGVYSKCSSPLITGADLWQDRIAADDLLVPYRNLWLLSTGLAFAASCGEKSLHAAFINSNHVREIDASKNFLDNITSNFEALGNVKIYFLFRDWTKEMVLRRGIELGIQPRHTFSCQINRSVPCGACPNCVERLIAIEATRGRVHRGHES